MGLAASQTRFLTLTARKSDIEYQSQQICNSRMRLSQQLEQIATTYTDSLSNTNLFDSSKNPTVYTQINTASLATQGLQVVVVSTGQTYDDYTAPAGTYKKSVEEGLRDGTYILAGSANANSQTTMTITGKTGTYAPVDWHSNVNISDDLATADDGNAETIYNVKTADLQQKDKKLTLEMDKLDTEHKEIESELDAIKKVIQSNSESSFKTFA